ncbi:putative lipid-transfer protein DIR1 [Ipomoea triloba]|uniref:putative lipid-transfer protein DIR1 n=1 Tax=Ipomoea triloba TaxID=35885 RepID=UPI00125CEA1A|nr:putative lipid-transfer protein DIR1 [Ipomoea triloba]GMD57972.1 putative lipid-transfer protein DIR1 [Ipomoea batatas]
MSKTLFMVLSVLVMIVVANAQTTSSVICKVKVTELAECLPAISGAAPKDPTKACCDVLCKADLKCMCKLKPQLAKFGLSPEKAMKLPGKCGLKVPRQC